MIRFSLLPQRGQPMDFRLPPPPPFDSHKGWCRCGDWRLLSRDSNVFYLDWETSGYKVCVIATSEGFDWRSVKSGTAIPGGSLIETWFGRGHESTLSEALDAADASLRNHLQQ